MVTISMVLLLLTMPYVHRIYVGLARTIYIRCTVYILFWLGNHKIYSHIRRIYTVLANPIYIDTSKCMV